MGRNIVLLFACLFIHILTIRMAVKVTPEHRHRLSDYGSWEYEPCDHAEQRSKCLARELEHQRFGPELRKAFDNIKLSISEIIELKPPFSKEGMYGRMTSTMVPPDLSTIKSGVSRSGSGTIKYDGFMFGSGLSLRDKELMSLRVCTHGCHGFDIDSAIVVGDVERQGRNFLIKNVAEEPVLHSDRGSWTGPEDARLDVLNDRVFLYFNVNAQNPDLMYCPGYDDGMLRKIHFKWLGENSDKTCMLQPPGADKCRTEKNWASLIIPGSDHPFFVYSVKPFQAFKLNTKTCHIHQVAGEWDPEPDMTIRGSSRYVKGIEVPEGDIYWAMTHTPPPTYKTLISSVLVSARTPHRKTLVKSEVATPGSSFSDAIDEAVRATSSEARQNLRESRLQASEIENPGMQLPTSMAESSAFNSSGQSKNATPRLRHKSTRHAEDTPNFQYLGTSCAVPTTFHELREYAFAYPSSVIRFDPELDVGHVTFHIDDSKVVRSNIHGVSLYLREAYEQFMKTGAPFLCAY